MIKYQVTYAKTYKHTANLITKEYKGNYLVVDTANNKLIIDNIVVEKDLSKIIDVRFLVNGYNQIMYITPTATIEATDIEYKKGSE